MSCLGESIAFRRAAEALAVGLRDPNLTAEEAAKLREDIQWHEHEYELCWAAARQECLDDFADDDGGEDMEHCES